jgi:hypothetical protein
MEDPLKMNDLRAFPQRNTKALFLYQNFPNSRTQKMRVCEKISEKLALFELVKRAAIKHCKISRARAGLDFPRTS